MLFNSFDFLFLFLPVVVAGFYLLRMLPMRWPQQLWLVGASLYFYSFWEVDFLPVLLASLGVNYLVSRGVDRWRSCWLLVLGIAFNVGLLGYFKYADFFIAQVNALWGTKHSFWNLALPLGISFYTFQQIAFLVDAYRGKVPRTVGAELCELCDVFPAADSGADRAPCGNDATVCRSEAHRLAVDPLGGVFVCGGVE